MWRKRLPSTLGRKSREANYQQVMSCINIAIKCLEENIYKRPNIGDIIRELNKASIIFQESLEGEVRPLMPYYLSIEETLGPCLLDNYPECVYF
jgi:hypothetical protein